ncbi:MAG: multiheme c-type cytochrome [Anaeromyxobacter sp.]
MSVRPEVNLHAAVAALAALALLAGGPARAGDTVGPETCKACHPAAYEAWKNGPHARAQDSLTGKGRTDARCLSCHAPQLEDGLAGVTCEACHGAGGRYSARYVMKDAELARAVGLVDPNEKTCLACHTDSTPSLVRFEHAKKRQLIKHWDEKPRPGGPPAPRSTK